MMTLPTAPHAQMEIPPDSYERVRLIGTINGLTGEFTPNPATIPATDGRPFAPEQEYHVTVETPPENPTEKKIAQLHQARGNWRQMRHGHIAP